MRPFSVVNSYRFSTDNENENNAYFLRLLVPHLTSKNEWIVEANKPLEKHGLSKVLEAGAGTHRPLSFVVS
jgi:hypothetical protein